MNKNLIVLLIGVILIAQCTSRNAANGNETITTSSSIETVCSSDEDICIVGTPGLLSRQTILSGSDSYFSLILRNNLRGQDASNVEVELQNVGPFKIVEGSNYEEIDGSCSISEGVWAPYIERNISISPDPQFADDFGLPFSKHMLAKMYPDEEIEFLWRLRAPGYQEIADVAYPHTFNYRVIYDYKVGVVQTIYSISEEEYQRVLRVEGAPPTTTGTITSSVGPLLIESSVEEPVRIQEAQSQFTMTYRVSNQRAGFPVTPAMFLLQVPRGVEHVGRFNGLNTLATEGYLDLMQATIFYNISGIGLEGAVCIPEDYDIYSETLKNGGGLTIQGADTSCNGDFRKVSLSNLLAYIRETFPDLQVNESYPNFVIKYIYPTDLFDELNYLYFPLEVVEEVNISKYYTFRLKSSYRYSFTGESEIMVVPNTGGFDTTTSPPPGLVWGNMKPYWQYTGKEYTAYGNSLSINSESTTLTSYVRDLGNYKGANNLKTNTFLHIIGITNNAGERPAYKCESDSDCGLGYCKPCTETLCSADGNNYCHVCFTEDDCKVLKISGDFYGIDIGYTPTDSHIYKVDALSTGANYYYVPNGKTVYVYAELPYYNMGALDNSFRQDENNHRLTGVEGLTSIEEMQSKISEFVTGRAFFELRNATGIVISDSDPISITYDIPSYTPGPAGLSLLSPLENETLFNITVGTSEVVGVYASTLGALATDKLILYVFNDAPADGKYHTYLFDVRLMNASSNLLGEIVVSKDTTPNTFVNLTNNQVRVMTNAFASLNPEDPNTRTLANGLIPSGVLKYSLDINDLNAQITDCSRHLSGGSYLNPALILNISSITVSGGNLDIEDSYANKVVIIGTGITDKALYGVPNTAEYYEGVVNACYIP